MLYKQTQHLTEMYDDAAQKHYGSSCLRYQTIRLIMILRAIRKICKVWKWKNKEKTEPMSCITTDDIGKLGSRPLASFISSLVTSPAAAVLNVPRLHTCKPDSSTQNIPLVCSFDILNFTCWLLSFRDKDLVIYNIIIPDLCCNQRSVPEVLISKIPLQLTNLFRMTIRNVSILLYTKKESWQWNHRPFSSPPSVNQEMQGSLL